MARRWISETLFRGVRVSFEADTVLHDSTTGHHRLELIENSVFGRMLLLDGAVQVASADEFVYHEMMSHVPILAHGAVRDVLIVGGGDAGLAEEVLKHRQVETVLQVEIDASVVELSRKHFGAFNAAAFADPRWSVEIADGAAFVRGTDRRFDVILVDSTDPSDTSAALFTEAFYADLSRCLRPGGIVVTQSGVPFLQEAGLRSSMRALARAFDTVSCYVAAVPTYFGGHLALGWGSHGRAALDTDVGVLTTRSAEVCRDTRYYTPEVHRAAFALPRYIARALDEAVGAR
jgi:spermidine synthase